MVFRGSISSVFLLQLLLAVLCCAQEAEPTNDYSFKLEDPEASDRDRSEGSEDPATRDIGKPELTHVGKLADEATFHKAAILDSGEHELPDIGKLADTVTVHKGPGKDANVPRHPLPAQADAEALGSRPEAPVSKPEVLVSKPKMSVGAIAGADIATVPPHPPAAAIVPAQAVPTHQGGDLPTCGCQAFVPVKGGFVPKPVPAALTVDGAETAIASQFVLDAGCRVPLREGQQMSQCLEGSWVMVIGASLANIWTVQLANSLVPNALESRRDHFSIDGVYTQLIDLVIEDGRVVYRRIVEDPWRRSAKHISAHTPKRDSQVLPEAFRLVHNTTRFKPWAIRITYFFAQFWDDVKYSLNAVRADHEWAPAKVFLAADIGIWYANSFHCDTAHGPAVWCATRPYLTNLTVAQLTARFEQDMWQAVKGLQEFCSIHGRASQHGCTILSMNNCNGGYLPVMPSLYGTSKVIMQKVATKWLRFFDLWTLTQELGEKCLAGHQSPMSTSWTWQLLLGSFCPAHVSSRGRVAVFSGPTCTTKQVLEQCFSTFAQQGFHYTWECGMHIPCKMTAVDPPHPEPQSFIPVAEFETAAHIPAWRKPWSFMAGTVLTAVLLASVACSARSVGRLSSMRGNMFFCQGPSNDASAENLEDLIPVLAESHC